MIEGRDSGSYVAAVRREFPETWLFRPPGSGNLVLAAAGTRVSEEELQRRAAALDAQAAYGFSFQLLLSQLVR
jgi:hypothetical protein